MSARTLVLTLAVLLLAPAAAAAKGVEDAAACGKTECVMPINEDTYLLFAGPREPAAAPAKRTPYFELRWAQVVDGDHHELVPMKAHFVPRAGLLRMEDGTWERPDARAAEALRRFMTGVEPFGQAKRRSRRVAAQAGGVEPALVAGGALVLVAAGLMVRRRRRPAAG